jgi:lysophospholipase L1-like esterase
MKRKACGWLVVLLLFVSERAAWCAETNHDFAKWEKEIAAFERMDRTNPPPKDAVLFTGASTIRRWKTLAQDFPGQPVLNRGFGGSEVLDATHFADRIIFPYAPRMIFLRSGGNDLWRGKSPEQVFADFQEFVAKIRAKLPETEIIFISASPSPSRWAQHEKDQALNALVQQFVRGKPHLKYVDTYPMVLGADGRPRAELFVADQLHFNAAGYALLADKVRPFLPPPSVSAKAEAAPSAPADLISHRTASNSFLYREHARQQSTHVR